MQMYVEDIRYEFKDAQLLLSMRDIYRFLRGTRPSGSMGKKHSNILVKMNGAIINGGSGTNFAYAVPAKHLHSFINKYSEDEGKSQMIEGYVKYLASNQSSLEEISYAEYLQTLEQLNNIIAIKSQRITELENHILSLRQLVNSLS